MDKETSKAMFLNLAQGDVITAPDKKGAVIVLRTGPNDLKFLAEVCSCDTPHLTPFPFYVKWGDARGEPVSTDGTPIIGGWDKVQVDKGAKKDLATQFAHLPLDEDYDNSEMVARFEAKPFFDDETMQKLARLFSLSEASDTLNIITALRLLGVTISDEQAITVILMKEAADEHLEEIQSFAALLSGSVFGQHRSLAG